MIWCSLVEINVIEIPSMTLNIFKYRWNFITLDMIITRPTTTKGMPVSNDNGILKAISIKIA
jgi:hypothetical protein